MVRNLVGAGVGSSILNMQPLTDQTHSGKSVTAVPIRPPIQSLSLVLGYLDGNPRLLVSAVTQSFLDYFNSPAAQKLIVPNTRVLRRRATNKQTSPSENLYSDT